MKCRSAHQVAVHSTLAVHSYQSAAALTCRRWCQFLMGALSPVTSAHPVEG